MELACGCLSYSVDLLLELYRLEGLVAVDVFMGESVFLLISASQNDVYLLFVFFAVVEGDQDPVF